MAGLKRLLRSRCTAFERELLQAGVAERPPLKTQRRIAGALGVSPLVFYVSMARAFIGSALVKAGLGAVVVAGMAAATLDSSGGASDEPALEPPRYVASPTTPKPPGLAVPSAPAPSGIGPAVAPDPGARAASPIGPGVRRGAKGVSVSKSALPSTLAEEVSLLDRARALINSGRHEHALKRLNEYRRRFPSGVLARESELLRGRLRR